MHYDEVTQITTDFDWFATDSRGCIGHFASAGGLLPGTVAQSVSDHQKTVAFFASLPDRCEGVVNAGFARMASLQTLAAQENYLKSLVAFSRKGFVFV